MNIVLWVLQGILALAFIGAGLLKATQPIATLSKNMAWAAAVPSWLVRFIGISEFLGGVGLILPALFKVAPWLTVVAAGALAFVMLLAALFHLMRKEYNTILPSIILLLLSAFVLYGRWVLEPITA